MGTILPLVILVVLLGCNATVNQSQSSIKHEENMTSAMLSLTYKHCINKSANAGDLFENHISALQNTAQQNDLSDFKIENKAMDIYTQDSCTTASIQLSASFRYNSKKINTLYQKLHDEGANDWEFSLFTY